MVQNKTVKVRMTAAVHRLHINKNIRFQTKIMWKRGILAPTQAITKPKPALSGMNTAIPSTKKRFPSI